MKIKQIIVISLLTSIIITGCSTKKSNDKKILRIATDQEIKTLDPAKANDDTSYDAIRMFTEGLYDFNRSHKMSKRLASKHTVSDDGLTHTFSIKKNAKWSNGDPVTADDFIYAWKRALALHTTNSYYFTSAGIHLKGANEVYKKEHPTAEDLDKLAIKKISKRKFRIKLTERVNEISYILSLPVFFPVNHKFVENNKEKFGTSPQYVLSNSMYIAKEKSKTKAIFKRNKDYINKDAGNVDQIIMTMHQSTKKSIELFKQNKVDYTQINLNQVKQFKNKDVLIENKENEMVYLVPNFNNKYLKRKQIRKAISYAINRKKLTEDILDDNVVKALGIIPTSYHYDSYDRSLRTVNDHSYPHSLTKANKLLGKSTKNSIINLELVYSNYSEIAKYLQKSINKTDYINIKLKKVDDVNTYCKTHSFALALTSYKPAVNNSVEFLNYLQDGYGYNYGHYYNKQYDALVTLRNTGIDEDDRLYITIAAEDQAVEDMALIPLVQVKSFYLMSTKLQTMGDNGIGHYTTFVPNNFTYTIIK